jgi:cell division protein FtsB
MFVASALVLDALIGDSGLVAIRRASHERRALVESLGMLRAENAALRHEAERLQSEPRAIETVARQELGLALSGELVVFLRTPEP